MKKKKTREEGKMNKERMMTRRDDRKKGLNRRQDEGWKVRYEREYDSQGEALKN